MKEERFYKLIDKLFLDCMEIMKSKGVAYSGLDDKLGNFKRVAKSLALTPQQVWYVYFAKHLDALSAFLRGEYNDSEPIGGRIKDLINYLFLLHALLNEGDDEDRGDVPIINEEGHSNEELPPGSIIDMFWNKKKKRWEDKNSEWVVGTGKK